jgi:virginiamycin B lyase
MEADTTQENGIYGQRNSQTGYMKVYDAPHGRGPYGITTTANGEAYYASLAVY